jgi:hypothetical protein
MRHALELGYKWTLLGLASYLKKPCKTGEFRHSLSKLHIRLGDDVRDLCQRLGIEIPDFNRRYVEAESVLKVFEQLDKEEFAFRYPTDRNRRKMAFAAGQTINLVDIKNDYDNAMVLLRHTLNIVGEHIDPDDEWHRKVW